MSYEQYIEAPLIIEKATQLKIAIDFVSEHRSKPYSASRHGANCHTNRIALPALIEKNNVAKTAIPIITSPIVLISSVLTQDSNYSI